MVEIETTLAIPSKDIWDITQRIPPIILGKAKAIGIVPDEGSVKQVEPSAIAKDLLIQFASNEPDVALR